jgi:hypothetical protein
VIAFLCCGPSRAAAQTADAQALREEIDQLRKELADMQKRYDDRITALEARLGDQVPTPGAPVPPDQTPAPAAEVPAGAAGAGGPTGSLPIYGVATAASSSRSVRKVSSSKRVSSRSRLSPVGCW